MAKRKNVDEDFEHIEGEISDSESEAAGDIVSNAADVPLFAGAGFANNRSIAKLKLVKLDNPGAGYKGEIPNNSTLETIGQLFGDGLYNIEAVNGRGVRLRVLENQRIALGHSPHESARAGATTNVLQPTTDVDRIERLALKSANESVQQAAAFRELVVTTTNAAAAREREFLQGVTAQSQSFMASLMAAQTQGFTQQMALLQAGHQQMIEALGVLRKGSGDAEGSAERLMAIFMQGMNMGRQFEGGGEEQPFWQEIIKGGIGVLGAAREKQLAATNPEPPTKSKVSAGASKLNKLVSAMRKRGIDADRLIDMLESGGNSAAPPDETESDETDESDERPAGPIFTSS
jgi:hypothetical protein